MSEQHERWPALQYDAWKDTYATLHLWTQVVGKVRLAQTPWVNHSWHVPLYVTTRGLTTTPIPHQHRTFQIDFDFIEHQLVISTLDAARTLALRPQSVAEFYGSVMDALAALDVPVKITRTPNEIADAIPFDQDNQHTSYDPEYANRHWRVLAEADRVFKEFRAGFIGKCSPTHFFWGSFDLAVTRFSGRTAPPHPGGVPNLPDWVAREAYSHEVSSAGFWAGGGPHPFPLFYSYAYPAPPGFDAAPVQPEGARYSAELGEFILPYEDVRTAGDPDAALRSFLQSTYEAAADLARWDRAALKRPLNPGAG